MALTIIATPGATNANSYATVDEGDDYHDTHPYPDDWENAGTDDKARALVTATRMLDDWFDWKGSITAVNQALLWPRSGVLRPGVSQEQPDVIRNEWHEPFGVLLDQDTIPAQIRNATAELARALLASNRTADSDIETQGISSIQAGPVNLSFKASVAAKPIPDAVQIMVSQLGRLRDKTGAGAVSMRRG